jgi:hypothetical protein
MAAVLATRASGEVSSKKRRDDKTLSTVHSRVGRSTVINLITVLIQSLD